MKIPPCPLSVWRNLYDAALAFREIQPWQWMSDDQVFGVQNPENDEVGYCCVLGELGEVLGLVVYLGTAGLEQHRNIQSGKLRAGSPEMLHDQSCLTAWFSNRSELDKSDIKIATQLGLKPKGRNGWPQFRSFRPGYHPWFLTESEARYLTLCLEQACDVTLRIGQDPNWLSAPSKDHYRVRVPVENQEAQEVAETHRAARPLYFESPTSQQLLFADAAPSPTWQWRDQWLKPAPLPKSIARSLPLDEVRLRRILNTNPMQKSIWEIDSIRTTEPVDGDERPYFPYMLLTADHASGFILGVVLASPATRDSEFVAAFLGSMEQCQFFPENIWLRNSELASLFEPVTKRLGIKIEMTKKLPELDRAKREFSKFTKNRR